MWRFAVGMLWLWAQLAHAQATTPGTDVSASAAVGAAVDSNIALSLVDASPEAIGLADARAAVNRGQRFWVSASIAVDGRKAQIRPAFDRLRSRAHVGFGHQWPRHLIGLEASAFDITGRDAVANNNLTLLAAAGRLQLRGEGWQLSAWTGARRLAYVENAFSWRAPRLAAEWRAAWQRAEKWALTATGSLELRRYRSTAWIATCSTGDQCVQPSGEPRADQVMSAVAEVSRDATWVASGGAGLDWTTSNSVGQSFVRGRMFAAATRALSPRWLASGRAELVVQRGEQAFEATIADEAGEQSRSSLTGQATWLFSDHWHLEARATTWIGLGTDYRRALVTLKLIWQSTAP